MSKTYIFSPIDTASGSVKIKFTVDNGLSGTENISGDYFIESLESNDCVEDMGFGGNHRYKTIDIELYDRNNLFYDTIFKQTSGSYSITECDCTITLNDSFCIIYGYVDLSSVSFKTIHRGNATYRTCRFTVLDMISKLQTIVLSTFYESLAGDILTQNPFDTGVPINDIHSYVVGGQVVTQTLDVVSMRSVFTRLLQAGVPNTKYLHSGIIQSFIAANPFESSDAHTFDELYVLYRSAYNGYNIASGSEPPYFHSMSASLFDSNLSVNLLQFNNCWELLNQLCKDYLCYPILRYDARHDECELRLKQRGGQNLKAEPAELVKESESIFYGYNTVKVVPEMTLASSYDVAYFYPTEYTDTNFIASDKGKGDFTVYFRLYDLTMGDSVGAYWHSSDLGAVTHPRGFVSERSLCHYVFSQRYGYKLREIDKIRDNRFRTDAVGITDYTYEDWTQYIYDAVGKYWVHTDWKVVPDETTPNVKFPIMKEKTYVGIGEDIELLDSFNINDVEYSITEIKRDFIENEVSMKLVQY